MNFDDYKVWIRFRDHNIYQYIVNLTKEPVLNNDKDEDIDNSYLINDDKVAELLFLESIYNNVLEINKNMSKFKQELNFNLFTHLLILQSQYLSTTIYKDYEIENALKTIGYITTSVSDSSTSVSYTPSSAITNQSLNDGLYNITKFGREYLILLEQLQSFIVVL